MGDAHAVLADSVLWGGLVADYRPSVAINPQSPWFVLYVFVASLLAVALLTWLMDDAVNWGNSIFIAAAAVVGTLIGRVVRSRRTQ